MSTTRAAASNRPHMKSFARHERRWNAAKFASGIPVSLSCGRDQPSFVAGSLVNTGLGANGVSCAKLRRWPDGRSASSLSERAITSIATARRRSSSKRASSSPASCSHPSPNNGVAAAGSTRPATLNSASAPSRSDGITSMPSITAARAPADAPGAAASTFLWKSKSSVSPWSIRSRAISNRMRSTWPALAIAGRRTSSSSCSTRCAARTPHCHSPPRSGSRVSGIHGSAPFGPSDWSAARAAAGSPSSSSSDAILRRCRYAGRSAVAVATSVLRSSSINRIAGRSAPSSPRRVARSIALSWSTNGAERGSDTIGPRIWVSVGASSDASAQTSAGGSAFM